VALIPQDFVRHYFFNPANNNQITDPQLTSVSRTVDFGLDPRPSAAGPAATGASVPSDGFFTTTAYYGAFNPAGPVWVDGWTAISNNRLTTEVSKETRVPETYTLDQNYPNPFNPATTIRFALPAGHRVALRVYDMLGREVGTLLDEFRNAGVHEMTFDAGRLATGLYFYKLTAGNFSQIKKMLLVK
ncbi:MAG TPA: T9SS type A sorting domain-containing protein, partial [Bacteroidota bacterium]